MKLVVQGWEAYVTDKKKVPLPQDLYERILSFDEETMLDWIKKYTLDKTPKEILKIMKDLGDVGYFDDAADLSHDEIEHVVVKFLQHQKEKNENT